MKFLYAILFSLTLLATPAFGQTDVTKTCNEESGLSWASNTEADMDKYRVYASNSPIDSAVDNTTLILMEIPHDNTNGTIKSTLDSTLSEGPKYFRITALDKARNESNMSIEVGCKYDVKPGIVTGVTIILQLQAN